MLPRNVESEDTQIWPCILVSPLQLLLFFRSTSGDTNLAGAVKTEGAKLLRCFALEGIEARLSTLYIKSRLRVLFMQGGVIIGVQLCGSGGCRQGFAACAPVGSKL